MGRPIKVEPESKDCTVCKTHKTKENFRLEPRPANPNNRRNQCNDCRNKLTRERLTKNDTHRKRYKDMTEDDRKTYIRYKSEMNQIRFKTKPELLAKKKLYDKTDKAIYNRYKSDCNRRGRLIRNITMELSFEQFKVLINSSCSYCGSENARGVDRIDSSKNYSVENSVPCCKKCNKMKMNSSKESFLNHVRKIVDFQTIAP